MFLNKKTGSPRRARPAGRVPRLPGLFDGLEAAAVLKGPNPAAIPEPSAAPVPGGRPEARESLPVAAIAARVWSVAELVREVRGLVERQYGRVTVEGEISNWRPAASGHCYFTLKDGTAQLSVVMFRRQASLIRFQPKDGDAIRLRG